MPVVGRIECYVVHREKRDIVSGIFWPFVRPNLFVLMLRVIWRIFHQIIENFGWFLVLSYQLLSQRALIGFLPFAKFMKLVIVSSLYLGEKAILGQLFCVYVESRLSLLNESFPLVPEWLRRTALISK